MDTHLIIKQMRESMGLSQQQLAELVGYKDRSSIAKVEAGLVDLSRTKIEAFAKVFHLSPAALIGSDDEAVKAAEEELKKKTAVLSARAITTASMYDALDDSAKDVIDAMIRLQLSKEGKK